jgi:hypothetical protein
VALERLDETRLVRRGQISPNRLHTRRSFDIESACGYLFEAEHGPVDIRLFAVILEGDRTHHLARLGNRNNSVRRAEIDADRSPVPHHWSRDSAASLRPPRKGYTRPKRPIVFVYDWQPRDRAGRFARCPVTAGIGATPSLPRIPAKVPSPSLCGPC